MSVEDTIKDCINYLNEDVCNKSFLTYEEEREWEDYITRLINNSNKEKDKEIERLQKDLTYYQEYSADLLNKNNTFENIIKEVREYIENDIKGNYFKRYDDKVYEMCEELLGILDKGE